MRNDGHAEMPLPVNEFDEQPYLDWDWWERLHRHFYPRLGSFAVKRGCGLEEAGVIANDAIADLMIYYRDPAAEHIPSVSRWLFTRVRRKCEEIQRRRRREGTLPDWALLPTKTMVEPYAFAELMETLRLLRDLPELYREAIIMNIWTGTYEELGLALGCSAEAARKRVARGRSMLRRRLAGTAKPAGVRS